MKKFFTLGLFPETKNKNIDTAFAHIIYKTNETLTDYIVEVDYMNVHIKVTVKGNVMHVLMTNIDSGATIYDYTYNMNSSQYDFPGTEGSFGFRMRALGSGGLNNLSTTGLDNLVVSTYGEPVKKTEVKLTIGSTTAYINGEAQTLDAAPINRNNRTMLPVRFLANALGIDNDGIKWDAATRTATLSNNEVTIVVTIDAPTMTVNGETVALDSPAIIAYDRTYLPVRAIANALGVSNENIAWDAETSTATLVK